MIRITDSHCHLDFPDFETELSEVVERAVAAGVHRMVTICTKLHQEPTVRAIAEAHDPSTMRLGPSDERCKRTHDIG